MVSEKKKQKPIWELSFAKIKKLRKEIVLNSLFVKDYENSLGINPEEVLMYFDQYMTFLLANVESTRGQGEGLSDTETINAALSMDTWENLKFFHQNYDRL